MVAHDSNPLIDDASREAQQKEDRAFKKKVASILKPSFVLVERNAFASKRCYFKKDVR
jgi:hypothetical protein